MISNKIILFVIITIVAISIFVPTFARGTRAGEPPIDDLWRVMPEGETPPKIDAGKLPQHYLSLALNASTLRARLAQAPPEWSAQARTSPLILSLPLPDGSLAHFRVEKSPIMACHQLLLWRRGRR